jgi:hypothetical protein
MLDDAATSRLLCAVSTSEAAFVQQDPNARSWSPGLQSASDAPATPGTAGDRVSRRPLNVPPKIRSTTQAEPVRARENQCTTRRTRRTS